MPTNEVRRPKVITLIHTLVGADQVDTDLEAGVVGTGKKAKDLLKRTMGLAGSMTTVIALSTIVLPFIFNKIYDLLGLGEEDEEAQDLSEIEASVEEETASISVTTSVKKLLGKPEEVLPPSVSTPVKSKVDLSGVQLVQPSERVFDYISEAASISGIDKALLLTIAHQESKFKTGAKSNIGARGLFQVTPKSWNYLVGKYGKKLGIKKKDHKNPRANAIIGAIYVRQIINSLKRKLGHKPSVTDIYAGYFLGPTGVRKLLNALAKNPDAPAAKLLPQAAKYNKNIFYKDGKSKTVAEVYATLYGKVGLQYLKFSEQEDLMPQFGIVTSFGNASTPVIPMQVSVPREQEATPEPISIRLKDKANTTPVKMEVDLPKKPVVEEKDTKLERQIRDDVSLITPAVAAKEFSFIRDRRGRLMTLEAPNG